MQNCVFLCNLDNFLSKTVIIFFFGKSSFKMALIWKKGYFEPTFHIFFSHQGKDTKIPYIQRRILLTLLICFALPILQKLRIYQVWFLFGMTPGVDSFSCHLKAINK